MDTQRAITILLPDDVDLRAALGAFQGVCQAWSEPCYNEGDPLGALALQRACYHQVKGTLNSQMTISAVRVVAAAYQSAKRKGHPAEKPLEFRKPRALYLVGVLSTCCSADPIHP